MAKTLAECLLRRKELQEKVSQVSAIKKADVFETKAKRVKVTDDVEDFIAEVPKLDLKQVTAEYDYYARQLRLIDAAIQRQNWTVEVSDVDDCFKDYKSEDE